MWQSNISATVKYFSERFFTRADLVQEEMEDTTAKLEKVNFMISGSTRSNTYDPYIAYLRINFTHNFLNI